MFAGNLQRNVHRGNSAAHIRHRGEIKSAAPIRLGRARLHPLRTVDGHFGLQAVRQHVDMFLARIRKQRDRALIFRADNQRSVSGEQIHKLLKRGIHILIGWVTIGMIVFEICYHRDMRFQSEEHTVIFIRFNDEESALARARVDFQIVQCAANDK